GLPADALGIRKLSLAIAQSAIGREEVDRRRIMHTDANALLRHLLDELQAGDAQPLERQERREHVPVVSRVAPRRQAHGRILAPQAEIAGGELPPPGIESLERGQLAQSHPCGHVREVGLAAGEEGIDLILRALALAVEAMELELTHFFFGAADDAATLDGGHVLVGMETEADEIAEAADAPAAPG